MIQNCLPLDAIELGGQDGPIESFQSIMLKLQSKLKPVTGIKSVGKWLV